MDDRDAMFLDSRSKSCVKLFCEKVEELIDLCDMKNILNDVMKNNTIVEELEYFYREITHLINRAIKKAQRLKRVMRFSREKINKISAIQYWRMKLAAKKGGHVNS